MRGIVKRLLAVPLILLASIAHAGGNIALFGVIEDVTCKSGCSAEFDDDLKAPFGVSAGYSFGSRIFIEPQVFLVPDMLGASLSAGIKAGDLRLSAGIGASRYGGSIEAEAGRETSGKRVEGEYWQAEASWRRLFVRYIAMDQDVSADIRENIGTADNPIWQHIRRDRVSLDREMIFIGYRHEF